ncbi:MAG: dUTP diphosphatase [Patescibacteria group bacterium]
MQVKVKKLNKDAIAPSYSLPGDAGLDMHCLKDYTIAPGERCQLQTGIALEYPPGYTALVWDKSGLSHKHGLHVLGGVFEYTYRGEYIIMLLNTSDKEYKFSKGDKICQLLIQPIESVEIEEVEKLSDSTRADRGFGSTGK